MAEAMAITSEQLRKDRSPLKSFLRQASRTIDGWSVPLLLSMSFLPRLFHIEEYLFFVFLLVAVALAWKARAALWVRTPIDVPLLLFLVWVLVTIPFAMDPAYSFAEWRKLAVQVLVFYWALLVFRRRDDRIVARILAAVMMGTIVLSIAALEDFLSRGGTWRDRLVRAGAPTSDYNWLSTYLIIAIPLLIAMIYSARAVWARALALMAAAVALLAQAASYTRAGWLGMVAQGVALGMVTARRIVIMCVLGSGLLLVSGLIIAAQMGYQRDTVDSMTWDARLAVWKLAAEETLAHPIVGIGYGNNTFMKRFAGYPETDIAAGYHNTFLMMAMGSGLPALFLFIWLFTAIFRRLVSHARTTTDTERYAFLIAVALVVVGFATRNLFDYMFAGSLAFLFWILVATAVHLTFDDKSVVS